MAPDKATLTAFTPKAQGEIERNKFAATTGGLVNLSASTYWELFYGAKAWHQHMQSQSPLQPEPASSFPAARAVG